MSTIVSTFWNSGRTLAEQGRTDKAADNASRLNYVAVEAGARFKSAISTIPTTVRATAQAVGGTFAGIGQALAKKLLPESWAVKFKNSQYPKEALKEASTLVGDVYQRLFQTVSRSTNFAPQPEGCYTEKFNRIFAERYTRASGHNRFFRPLTTRIVTVVGATVRILPQTLDAGIGLLAAPVSIASKFFSGDKTAENKSIEGLNALLPVLGAAALMGLLPAQLNNRWFKGFAVAGLAVSRVEDIARLIYADKQETASTKKTEATGIGSWRIWPWNWFGKTEEKQD